jgi:AcrR family transcriptional regulator
MGRALFADADFRRAARELAIEHGPAAVTVGAIAKRLRAPVGSFYHRFTSRDLLLGELWLETVHAYQQGFIAAIEAGDGLTAALHMPAWVRGHLDDARLLLLYSRHDFAEGNWPASLKRGVADQARRFVTYVERFAGAAFGRIGPEEIRRAQFVLVDVPGAAVKPHLQRRELPPLLIDDLIRATYDAIVGDRRVLRPRKEDSR